MKLSKTDVDNLDNSPAKRVSHQRLGGQNGLNFTATSRRKFKKPFGFKAPANYLRHPAEKKRKA